MIYALFDIDDTMTSMPDGTDRKTSVAMFRQVFGVDADESIANPIGKTEMMIIKEAMEKVGKPIDKVPDEAYKVWGENVAKELQKNPGRVLPGVVELLEALSKNPKVKLELLTGNAPERARAKLESTKLDKFFIDPSSNELVGALGNMAYKREELIEVIKKKLQPDDKFIIIDDSLIGANMVKKYQVSSILVATGNVSEDRLKEFSTNVFPDFGDNRWQKAVSIIESI
ncbi:HAD hydrolase-like protein [Candidatus Roizmanbacteria bacterium]|nr:HAD hydrolase-like protein [Candidatus Roizmanbacteria bacterium]